jgi:hypothetical protein
LDRVHQADAVGGFVGWGLVVIVGLVLQQNGIAIGIELWRRFHRGATQDDINGPAVRAGADTARTFADGDGGGDFEIGAADDGEVAGFFIGNENLIAGRRAAAGGGQQPGGAKTGGEGHRLE